MGLAGRRRELGLSLRRAAGTEREEGKREKRGREFSTADPGGQGQMWRGGEFPLPSGLGALRLGWDGAEPGALGSAPVPDWQGQLNLGPGITLGGRAGLHQSGP